MKEKTMFALILGTVLKKRGMEKFWKKGEVWKVLRIEK